MSGTLWLRWSWRDLRRRWGLVTAIALVIALGTGTYAGLGSTAEWRRQTNDASFAALLMHDVRLSLTPGAIAPAGDLAAAARRAGGDGSVVGVEERLVLPNQVDASTDGSAVLVPGELVGVDVTGPAEVDAVWVRDGRPLTPTDDGTDVAVLEHQFAELYDLPPTGMLTLSGGHELRYVGVGATPQHFVVTGRSGSVFAQGGYAVVIVPLATAQAVADAPGAVNEVVVRLRPGTDPAAYAEALVTSVDESLPGTAPTTTLRTEEPAHRLLYEDIENDQLFWNIIAGLVLLGAAFAAFNLVSRLVESQRREIGIGMALGVPRRRLALRPMLVGAEVALLGVAAGVAVGYLLDLWLRSVFASVLPMPLWQTPFQPAVFARAAVIGFVLPFAATAVPVWRALRVQPVDAIRAGYLAGGGGALTATIARIPMPGRSYRHMPVRNLLRAPRRTVLTTLALAAAIATMIAVIGTVDSFLRTLDAGETEVLGDAPDRLTVELDGFVPTDGDELRAIAGSAVVGRAEPGLRLPATVTNDGESIDLLADLLDFQTAMWRPTLSSGVVGDVLSGGLVLSEKAASDLDVDVGDTVTLRHPRRLGLGYELVSTEMVVAALHPNPVRNVAFLDVGHASIFGLEGITNLVEVRPALGVAEDDAKQVLFSIPGVSSVQGPAATVRLFRDAMAEFFGVLRAVEVIVLVLALLIAFNSASISVEERTREHATMLAFGLRPRAILGMVSLEGLLTGLLGTALGVLAGVVLIRWLIVGQLDDTMPDLGVIAYVSPATVLTAFVLGAVAVTVSPLLLGRRLTRVDIPSALRIME